MDREILTPPEQLEAEVIHGSMGWIPLKGSTKTITFKDVPEGTMVEIDTRLKGFGKVFTGLVLVVVGTLGLGLLSPIPFELHVTYTSVAAALSLAAFGWSYRNLRRNYEWIYDGLVKKVEATG